MLMSADDTAVGVDTHTVVDDCVLVSFLKTAPLLLLLSICVFPLVVLSLLSYFFGVTVDVIDLINLSPPSTRFNLLFSSNEKRNNQHAISQLLFWSVFVRVGFPPPPYPPPRNLQHIEDADEAAVETHGRQWQRYGAGIISHNLLS